MYTWKWNQDFHGKSGIQQEEESFHQQIGPKLKDETNELLDMEHSLVWCWNFDASENRSDLPWEFWNVELKKEEKISWTDLW